MLTGGGYCPWEDLGERYPGIHVALHPIAPAAAAWLPTERVILIDSGLSRVEGRCALAHEIAHIDLDHQPTGFGYFDARMERDADALAGRRLLPVGVLADVAGWDASWAAEELRVTVGLLHLRLTRLHPAEARALLSALQTVEAAA